MKANEAKPKNYHNKGNKNCLIFYLKRHLAFSRSSVRNSVSYTLGHIILFKQKSL